MKTKSVWVDTGRGNLVYEQKTFTISYNPNIVPNVFDTFLVGLGEAEDRVGKDETALFTIKSQKMWRILNGDFRKEYEKCKTISSALKVYNKYKAKNRSDFSTDHE